MTIRQAMPEDAAAICGIINPIIRHSTITFTTLERSEGSVRAEIEARGAAFQVAERQGEVVGYATFGAFRAGPGYARTAEHSVHVVASERGQGQGRAMMARLEQVARAQGIHVLVAGISGSNPAAISFHRRVGFDIAGKMPEVGYKDGRYLDLVLMQKRVGPGPDGAPDSVEQAG